MGIDEVRIDQVGIDEVEITPHHPLAVRKRLGMSIFILVLHLFFHSVLSTVKGQQLLSSAMVQHYGLLPVD